MLNSSIVITIIQKKRERLFSFNVSSNITLLSHLRFYFFFFNEIRHNNNVTNNNWYRFKLSTICFYTTKPISEGYRRSAFRNRKKKQEAYYRFSKFLLYSSKLKTLSVINGSQQKERWQKKVYFNPLSLSCRNVFHCVSIIVSSTSRRHYQSADELQKSSKTKSTK